MSTNHAQIENLEQRLLELEEVLARAAAGEFRPVEVLVDDALASVELGVNIVLEDLRNELLTSAEHNRELDAKVLERTRELGAKLDQITRQNQLIGQQQQAIRELSTPMLQLWDQIVAMPIIGVLDARRSVAITDKLLGAIADGKAHFAILDVTGVEIMDTNTASHLIGIVRSARLMGAECMLTGVQPAVAQTLVSLDIDFDDMPTRRNLHDGLRSCLLAMRPATGSKAKP